jgi:hypothetical protein
MTKDRPLETKLAVDTNSLAVRFDALYNSGTIFKSNQHSPTPESIKFIEAELALVLPKTLTELASRCLNYTEWFAGIGEDYEWSGHILRTNRELHDGKYGFLPTHLVPFTRGYDEVYDCFDLNDRDQQGNPSIVYCFVYQSEDSEKVREVECLNYSFDIYLDRMLQLWEKGKR